MTNSEIRVFQISIEKYINESALPTEIKRLVVSNVLHNLSAKVELEIQQELESSKEKE